MLPKDMNANRMIVTEQSVQNRTYEGWRESRERSRTEKDVFVWEAEREMSKHPLE